MSHQSIQEYATGLLDEAQERLSEGDYLNLCDALKKAVEMPKRTKLQIYEEQVNKWVDIKPNISLILKDTLHKPEDDDDAGFGGMVEIRFDNIKINFPDIKCYFREVKGSIVVEQYDSNVEHTHNFKSETSSYRIVSEILARYQPSTIEIEIKADSCNKNELEIIRWTYTEWCKRQKKTQTDYCNFWAEASMLMFKPITNASTEINSLIERKQCIINSID
jgi:hypothetical protein